MSISCFSMAKLFKVVNRKLGVLFSSSVHLSMDVAEVNSKLDSLLNMYKCERDYPDYRKLFVSISNKMTPHKGAPTFVGNPKSDLLLGICTMDKIVDNVVDKVSDKVGTVNNKLRSFVQNKKHLTEDELSWWPKYVEQSDNVGRPRGISKEGESILKDTTNHGIFHGSMVNKVHIMRVANLVLMIINYQNVLIKIQ